jgi:hypothetical protein
VPWQRRTVYVILGIITFFSLGYSGWGIFQCGVPGQGATFWEKKIAGQCDKPSVNAAVGYTHGIINALTDIAMSILPIQMIRKSKLQPKEKRSIYFIFLLAAV